MAATALVRPRRGMSIFASQPIELRYSAFTPSIISLGGTARMKSFFTLVLSLVVHLNLTPWMSHSVEAALITYQFSGTVETMSAPIYTLGGSGADGFYYGLTLTGRYTFDSTTPMITIPSLPPPPSYATGFYNGSIKSLGFSLGTY